MSDHGGQSALGSSLSAASARLLYPLAWVTGMFPMLIAPRFRCDRFTIANGSSVDPTSFFQKIEVALTLISEFSPRQYERMKLEMPRIMGVEAGGGQYLVGPKIALISAAFAQERSELVVATWLVEMGARARVMNRLKSHKFSQNESRQLWKITTRAQLAFVGRIPSARFGELPKLQEYLRVHLASYSVH